MLHQVHPRDRYIVRHLFGEVLQQVTVAGHGLFEGVHYLGSEPNAETQPRCGDSGPVPVRARSVAAAHSALQRNPSRRLRRVLGLLANRELLKKADGYRRDDPGGQCGDALDRVARPGRQL